MALYEVIYLARSRGRVPHRDAYGCGLMVTRDGENFQVFLPLVTGQELKGSTLEGNDRLWPALVAAGVDEIRRQVASTFKPISDRPRDEHLPISARSIERMLQEGRDRPETDDDAIGVIVGAFQGP